MRTLGIVVTQPGHRADLLLESALGRPVLEYCAASVLASYRLSRAVLVTGSPRVAAAAEELGLEIVASGPQPNALAAAAAATAALEAEEQRSYDAVMLLPAHYPLRTRDDIDGAIALLERTGADTVATFTERRSGISRFARIDPEGRVLEEAETFAGRAFLRDSSITCGRRHLLRSGPTLEGPDIRAWLIPPERCCVVEDEFDRYLLEQLLRYPGRPAA